MSDDERYDLVTVFDYDGTFHLRFSTIHSEDGTSMDGWCKEEFDIEDIDTFTVPMGVLRYEGLCLDCYYEKKKATKRMFERAGV